MDTSFGKVKVKVAELNDFSNKNKLMPEFEECKRLAKDNKKPLHEIYNMLMRELNG
jgi:uncharacterized protein (DUF111 family)